MNKARPAWGYLEVRQGSHPPGGIAGVTIHTAAELRLSTPLMEEVQMVDLDLFESAYRKGVERAEALCRQVFGGPDQRAAGNLP